MCKGPKGPGSQGRRPLCQSFLGGAVHYWAILAVAPTRILSIVALLTIKHDRISSLLMKPDTRQASRPKAAGTKLPTGSVH